jgi:5-formyltetrahydrofolate cyclo-ligase
MTVDVGEEAREFMVVAGSLIVEAGQGVDIPGREDAERLLKVLDCDGVGGADAPRERRSGRPSDDCCGRCHGSSPAFLDHLVFPSNIPGCFVDCRMNAIVAAAFLRGQPCSSATKRSSPVDPRTRSSLTLSESPCHLPPVPRTTWRRPRRSAARRAAFARRKAAHHSLGPAPPAATQALLACWPRRRRGRGRLPAHPHRNRPSPRHGRLHAEGRRLCVPVIEGDGRPLVFREWAPDAALVSGPFGVAVPESGEILTPEAVIAPLVAFDAALTRLGYGGGFYDRTLAGLPDARAVGFAYAAQRSATPLPREATDRRPARRRHRSRRPVVS